MTLYPENNFFDSSKNKGELVQGASDKFFEHSRVFEIFPRIVKLALKLVKNKLIQFSKTRFGISAESTDYLDFADGMLSFKQ